MILIVLIRTKTDRLNNRRLFANLSDIWYNLSEQTVIKGISVICVYVIFFANGA